MLTQIRIQNFRLCRDVHIENAGRIVALVGRNGAGKSNVFQAIATTARMATLSESPGAGEFRPGRQPGSVTLEFIADDSTAYRYVREVAGAQPRRPGGTIAPIITERLSYKEGDTWVLGVDRNGGVVTLAGQDRPLPIGDFTPCLPAVATLLPATDPVVQRIEPARSFLSALRYYPLDEPVAAGDEDRVIPHQEYAAWLATYKSTKSGGDSVLMRLVHMQLTNSGDLDTLGQLLGQDGLGLIDKVNVRTLPPPGAQASPDDTYYFVRFIPSRGSAAPVWVRYDDLSLGTRRAIRIFISMLFDKSTVMLIEQPEDGLHQGMTKKVVGLLRENADAQLFMSSHSSALLNQLLPDDVRIVFLHDGFTVVRPLTPKERDAAVKFMNDEGPLYDFIEPLQEE